MSERLSVLIVEDEPLIAMMLEDFVDTLGHETAGVVDNVASALTRVAQGGFDVAILDVQLRDGPSWPVADALSDRGVRFVMASGGHVEAPPARHAGAASIGKPFGLADVEAALSEHVDGR